METKRIILSGTEEDFIVLLKSLELFGIASNSLFYVENIETCNDFINQILSQFEIVGKQND